MTVLRATDVRFVQRQIDLVTPFSLLLAAGARGELMQPAPRAASIAARLCAAIVKPSAGTIYVGEYETRLQAPQAKRRVGFVDCAGFEGDLHAFRCEIAFHAEAWGIAREIARERANDALRALGSDDAYARAIALALVAPVSLVVLDQPAVEILEAVRSIASTAAIVYTRVVVARALERVPTLESAAT